MEYLVAVCLTIPTPLPQGPEKELQPKHTTPEEETIQPSDELSLEEIVPGDLFFLPPPDVCAANYRIASMYKKKISFLRKNRPEVMLPCPDVWINDAHYRFNVWNELDNAWRRMGSNELDSMEKVRRIVGTEAFFKGDFPEPVPTLYDGSHIRLDPWPYDLP